MKKIIIGIIVLGLLVFCFIPSKYNSKYKLIFITDKEWKELLSNFDKDKKYKLMKEDKYVNESADTVSLAESLFEDKIEVK